MLLRFLSLALLLLHTAQAQRGVPQWKILHDSAVKALNVERELTDKEKETLVGRMRKVTTLLDCPREGHCLDVYYNAALVADRAGQVQTAVDWLKQIVEWDPTTSKEGAFHLLAGLHNKLDKQEEAVEWYLRNPKLALEERLRVMMQQVAIFRANEKLGKALDLLRREERAHGNRWSHLEYHELAVAIVNGGVHEPEWRRDALATLQKAIDLSSEDNAEGRRALATYHREVADLLRGTNDAVGAQTAYRRAADIDPSADYVLSSLVHSSMTMCDWDNVTAVENELMAILRGNNVRLNPFQALFLPLEPAMYKDIGRRHYEREAARVMMQSDKIDEVNRARLASARRPGPMRIGILSSDLRQTVMAVYLQPFLADLAKHCQVFVYSAVAQEDRSFVLHQIKEHATVFRNLGNMTDEDAGQVMRSVDDIDILIDANGWTGAARLTLLGQRAARYAQWTAMGFPGTTGAPVVDHYVGDRHVTPAHVVDRLFSEKIVFLSQYQINHHNGTIARPPVDRPRHKRPPSDDRIVLASLNQVHKIDRQVFDVWMRILNRLPNAELWLLAERKSTITKANLLKEAARHGVAAERIVFVDRLTAVDGYYDRFLDIDVFLDTLLYNAHCSASDALWMRTPVVTLSRNAATTQMAKRVAEGLGAKAASSLAEYEDLVLRAARGEQWDSEHAGVFDRDRNVREWVRALEALIEVSVARSRRVDMHLVVS